MNPLLSIVLAAALGAAGPRARLEPHDGALWYSHVILSSGGERGFDLELASSSDLPFSGLFGRGFGITEETTIAVLPGGALHVTDPGPCPACSVVVAEPTPGILAASVEAAASTLRASGVSRLADEATAYASRLRNETGFRESEWRRQSDAWLAAARAETSGGVARVPVAAHFRAVALPGGFLRYSDVREIQEFDASGRLVRIVSADGMVRDVERDEQGRIRRITDAAGRSISFTLDDAGRVVRATSTRGLEVRIGYDPLGRLAWLDAPKGRLTHDWNAEGQLTGVIGDDVEIRATYLPRAQGGRLASLSTGPGAMERFSYERHADGLVQVTEVRDEPTEEPRAARVAGSEPWMETGVHPVRRYTYVEPLGSDGRRFVWQQLVEGGGSDRLTIYDERTFQPIALSDGDSTTAVRYDDFRRVVEHRRDGRVTTLEYGPFGKVSRVLRGGDPRDGLDAAPFEARYRYDSHGDLAEASDSEGRHVTVEYDSRRQITAIVAASGDDPIARRVDLRRNEAGRPVRIEVADAGFIDVTYGTDDEIDKVDSSRPGVAVAVTRVFGVLLELVRPANVRVQP